MNVPFGTIHLRRRQFFTIFDPLPPCVGSLLLLSIDKFDQFLTLSPLQIADVVNGWSLFCSIILMVAEIKKKIGARKYWKATYRTSHDNMVEPFYCFVVDL